MEKTINSQKVIIDAIKDYKGEFLTGEKKPLIAFLLDKIDFEILPPPEPEVKLTFSPLYQEEYECLKTFNGLDALKGLLQDIAKALYYYVVNADRELQGILKRKNVSSDVSESGFKFKEEFKYGSIQVRAYTPSESSLSEAVNAMIFDHINKKHKMPFPKSKDKLPLYMDRHIQTYRELECNRFIDTEGVPIVSLNAIKQYLTKRIKKEPTVIRCKWCNRTAYTFNPKQTFCYRPGCKVSMTRKIQKGQAT